MSIYDDEDLTKLTHDEKIRTECLDKAIRIHNNEPASKVVENAKEFETFIKGAN